MLVGQIRLYYKKQGTKKKIYMGEGDQVLILSKSACF